MGDEEEEYKAEYLDTAEDAEPEVRCGPRFRRNSSLQVRAMYTYFERACYDTSTGCITRTSIRHALCSFVSSMLGIALANTSLS